MAAYDFESERCGERFEVQRPMSAHDRLKEQAPTYPRCGATDTQQLVSVFSCKTPIA
jgi:putative FmdB family regulatory protein